MNAHSRNITARDTAEALLGKSRARQSVHRCTSTYGGGMPARHVVLVTPHGSEFGSYYEVSDAGWERLKGGATPEYLGLEPVELSEDQP